MYTYKKNRTINWSNKAKKVVRMMNDESEIEEPEFEEAEMRVIPDMQSRINDFVYRLDNHIYFTSDVTLLHTNLLSKLIYQANREYEITKATIKCGDLQASPIYLHIMSNGGDLFCGLRAMDMIENSFVPIYTVIEGYAQSAASLLFLAGKRRYMTENSYMLIHQLSSQGENGTYEQLKDNFSNNQILMDKIIDIYHKKSNGKLTKKKIQELLKRDLYWDFATCKSYNLADELYKLIPMNN